MFVAEHSNVSGVLDALVKPALGLRYARLDDPSQWPLRSEDTREQSIHRVLEFGFINCQLAVHLYFLLMTGLSLPFHFRSKELWEENQLLRFLAVSCDEKGGVVCDEALLPGDIFFFSREGELNYPEQYHLAIVVSVAQDGNHHLLHAVSRKNKTEKSLVLFRLNRIAHWDHRQLVGVKRVTVAG